MMTENNKMYLELPRVSALSRDHLPQSSPRKQPTQEQDFGNKSLHREWNLCRGNQNHLGNRTVSEAATPRSKAVEFFSEWS